MNSTKSASVLPVRVDPAAVLKRVAVPVRERPGARFHESWDGPVNKLVTRARVAQAIITGSIPVTALVAYGNPKTVRSLDAVSKRCTPAVKRLAQMGIAVV